MEVNYVLMYGTPYLRYKEFETFENISKFLINKNIVNYSVFKKLEDKEEVEMIYRDNDIKYLEKENKQLKDNWNKLKEYLQQDINNRNGNVVVEIENGNKISETISPIYVEMIDKSKAMKEILNKMQELENGDSNE